MVAVISMNRSLSRSFYYNEHKLKKGHASCILAENYPCEPDELSVKERLAVLLKRVVLNENLVKNCVHISLNFHPSDKLSKAKLQDIARMYMTLIGFGHQPYLVYQHWDVAHPHLHVLAVNIRSDGSWIDTYRMNMGISRKACRQIEKSHQLTVANGKFTVLSAGAGTQKLRYGKAPTAPTIAGVLAMVLPSFHYGSLIELNAVLRHYNVCAEPASCNAKILHRQGLVYRALSEDGRKIGVPIKASSFSAKPTLPSLNSRFISGKAHRTAHQQRVSSLIDLALLSSASSISELQEQLAQDGIKTVFAVSATGAVAELFFVDFKTRCVFSASGLGEKYAPSKLLEKFPDVRHVLSPNNTLSQQPSVLDQSAHVPIDASSRKRTDDSRAMADTDRSSVRLELFAPVADGDYLPWQLKKRSKKKRKEITIQL